MSLYLHGWTLHRTIGAKDTTIIGLGTQHDATLNALVKEEARVDRHSLIRLVAAMWASQCRFEFGSGGGHFPVPVWILEGNPAFVVAFTNADVFALSGSYLTVAVL
jgi:hypothetical protein